MRFKIVSEKVFEGRNLIAPVPVVRLVLDFAELSDHSSVRLGSEFTACLGNFSRCWKQTLAEEMIET
ncbi:MAG: hypothetical protein CFH39_02014 [Alphaproteobacteria bacterium MarineAlpha10_Bin2]|nr:MAG: hypothetical protein CFH39_02014 [Alphaproteobacteria bacterium MarineAlpha10_Bin2]